MFLKLNNYDFLRKNYSFLIFFLGILIVHQVIFQKFFPNSKGLIGHDYEYFVPHLMYGKIWFSNNFLSVPWFSPSFCCGTPFYSDPETMYYSLNQIIFLIFNPIVSIKIIFFIYSFISYVGMYFLMKKNFKLDRYTSLLCASLFLFNGYFIYRAIPGHVSHLSYVFIPLFCHFLINSFEKNLKSSRIVYFVLSSIIFANFFHSGSGPIIFMIFASIVFVLLFYSHLKKHLKIFINFISSLFIGVLISLSKISAVLFFINNFPRKYPMMQFDSFLPFIKTFFSSFFLKPNEKYFNDNISSMFPLGVHEIEYSVSIVPLILLFFIFFLKRKIFQFNYYNFQFFILLVLISLIPILFNVNFLNQFQLIEKIPLLNSTWVQVRWMSIYILPIIILSGFIIENLNINISKKKYLAISMIFLLFIQNITKDKSWHFEDSRYSLKNAADFSLKMKTGKLAEIVGPAVLMDKSGSIKRITGRNDMFFFSYSPLNCYHGIFGYGLEALNAKKIILNSKLILEDNSYILYSDKLDKSNDHFMMFNPSCFLFPQENNCLPGDTFKISEKEKLLKFANYKKFNFNQNKIQIFSNYISFFTFLSSLLYLLYSLVIFIYNLKKKY